VEDVVSGAGAVGLRVAPVQVVVIDEGAIEHNAAVRLKRRGQQVGGVGRSATVAGWAGLAFGVGLDGEAGKVRNQLVNLDGLGRPPGAHRRVERVEGSQTADFCGLAISTLTASRTPQGRMSVGHSRQLLQVFGIQQTRVCIDVVDVARR
jgi:hypothetical protein